MNIIIYLQWLEWPHKVGTTNNVVVSSNKVAATQPSYYGLNKCGYLTNAGCYYPNGLFINPSKLFCLELGCFKPYFNLWLNEPKRLFLTIIFCSVVLFETKKIFFGIAPRHF